ncbi:TPA: DUF3014 domain-containing protein [Xanthomonas vasicola pv. zeae]|uniref:Uncharacterized protein n=2 Tax=Xanthomonas vasicola pv. vasculorum TaxID=325776 RepID=A0A837APH8_XANVA|nr:DUF3014 domain-containing protein [Xanthomonas vasicola]AVQ07957.1 DUF3014 domain-containing protein [Xanthomonas vasicola pv. vasculorum]AZM72156.1 DUF3014 domain-containing protein [Xanthomonas vasicola pv. vasculorum]AZR31866.1 DUF3014 domain-containing protein [Xanthomonas vasicola pv. musacearum NCPPB 4379]KFA11371.1 hypothetical protein KWM_0106675 [Xanthomonas vasicola pv. musacearum NCPPB 2005]KFA14655.1 hypothetical protein KWQ_0103920 [Xanthomonas vasicola pv. musacearum NCPPB 438
MQTKSSRWPWLLAVPLIAGAAWWLFGGPAGTESTLPAPITRTASAVAAAVNPQPAPASNEPRHPVQAPSADAADAAIPPLAQSDDAAWEALLALVQDDTALSIVLRKHLIERVVVMIDNLTQPSISRRALVLQPVSGELQVSGPDTHQVIDQANAARYGPYVAAFTSVDAQALARSYVRFYPLFQQAYADLGAPDRYFNDRMIDVIDHLLRTPDPAQPIGVQRDERGRYRFVTPALESLSVGQKALLRLGPTQATAVKAQLQRIRAALLQGR